MAALDIVPSGRHIPRIHRVIVVPRVSRVKCRLGFKAYSPIGSCG